MTDRRRYVTFITLLCCKTKTLLQRLSEDLNVVIIETLNIEKKLTKIVDNISRY